MRKPDCAKCRNYNTEEFILCTFVRCAECGRMEKYKASLAKKRLFDEGATIQTLNELLEQECVLVHGRGKHIKAILNMQLGGVLRWLETGFFKKAVRKEKPNGQ